MRRCTTVGGLGASGIVGLGLLMGPLLIGCSDNQNSTELIPEGPPEILQVFVTERIMSGSATRTAAQLAFGSHPELDETDDGTVNTAVARAGQRIRIVFDELLVGNDIEEIACADGTFSAVPRGATPDDVAACAGEVEALGDCRDICIGANGPVGILDENDDGAADDFRMLSDAVTITCDGTTIPWNDQQSFYQPSGNQLIGAGPLGVNSLGPALVVIPQSGLRAGAACSIELSPNIVDKDDIRPCADGGSGCNPGDISAIAWSVEGLAVSGSDPLNNATNVNPALANGNANVLVQFNAAIDAATVANISVADETAAFPPCPDMNATGCLSAAVNMNDPTIVTITVRGGYTPDNMHTVTVPTTVTDIFGGPMPAEHTISFTTRAATPVADAAPMPDADTTDAGVDAAP